MATIEVDGVSKRLGGNDVLINVNAEFEPGQVTAVTGPNGSGKSVLFRLICGFLAPDTGAIRIAEEFLAPGSAFPQSFGILIDGPGYLPYQSGRKNLEQLAAIRGEIGMAQIDEAMRAVGLDPQLRRRVGSYSLGMKQKLGLAQAFMEDQQVLLLDEPFNGLDRSSVEHLHELLRQKRREGRTVVFTSHIHADVDALADRVYEIDAGALTRLH